MWLYGQVEVSSCLIFSVFPICSGGLSAPPILPFPSQNDCNRIRGRKNKSRVQTEKKNGRVKIKWWEDAAKKLFHWVISVVCFCPGSCPGSLSCHHLGMKKGWCPIPRIARRKSGSEPSAIKDSQGWRWPYILWPYLWLGLENTAGLGFFNNGLFIFVVF